MSYSAIAIGFLLAVVTPSSTWAQSAGTATDKPATAAVVGMITSI